MGKAGTRNHNRRALQRQLQYLMVKGIVKREVFVFRNLNDHYNHHAHYRLSSPYAIKVRENSMRTQLMPSETFLRSTIARDDLLPGQRIVLLALAFAPPQGMLTAELAEASGCSLPNTILYCKVLGDKGLAECINLGNPNKPVWRFKIKAAT